MHPLLDPSIVEAIQTTGKTDIHLPDRIGVLKAHSLPYDQPADTIIISGCQILSSLPQVLASLARILDQGNLSYSFLSEEYCCGNYLYRPAIKARDDDAMAECRSFSKTFVERNIGKAKDLGAKRLAIFCSPCYPIYRHAFPEEPIVFYPEVIGEAMGSLRYTGSIDYYAGCYKLHRRFSPLPMDLSSTDRVFDAIEDLEVNRISAPNCCFTADGLSHMIGSIIHATMVHICTGCYGQARGNLAEEKTTEVLMLPEFVERVMQQTGS
jgi:hypothetical protein